MVYKNDRRNFVNSVGKISGVSAKLEGRRLVANSAILGLWDLQPGQEITFSLDQPYKIYDKDIITCSSVSNADAVAIFNRAHSDLIDVNMFT
jgi:hypothetical protein